MALDYKQLQTCRAGQATTTDDYCPECGRPWRDRAREQPRPVAVFPWRAVLLTVVGLALVVAFGVRAARAAQQEAPIQRGLGALTACLGGGVSRSSACPTAQEAEFMLGGDDVDEATVRGRRDRALVATALGLLVLGVGLRGVVRRPWRQDHPQPSLATVGG
jgi:hypothetical protein